MSSSENELEGYEESQRIIELARRTAGAQIPDTVTGLRRAERILKKQHDKVVGIYGDASKVRPLIASNDALVLVHERSAEESLDLGDLPRATQSSNHVYAIGDIDYKDALGGRFFDGSVRFHRRFFDLVTERFSDSGPFLQVFGANLRNEVLAYRSLDEPYQELLSMRRGIHMTVLNGTLGSETRQFFDPFAVIELR